MAANQDSHTLRKQEPKYHVYVRLPFNRDGFVDPPPVDWDEAKSEELWGIMSGVAKTEIDWAHLAESFGVSVDFLLMMASCLAEYHASHLRAQMRKAATTRGSTAPSPVPGPEPFGPGTGSGPGTAEVMRRTGSGGGRAPSSLSIRKDTLGPKDDGTMSEAPAAAAALPLRPQGPRYPSLSSTVLNQNLAGAKGTTPRPLSSLSHRHHRPPPPIATNAAAAASRSSSGPASPEPAASVSSGSSSSSSSPVGSRIIRRPPRFQPQEGAGSLEEDEEAEPAFLPFEPQAPGASGSGRDAQDLGETLRGDPPDFAERLSKGPGRDRPHLSQTSDSSSSSAAMLSRRPTGDPRLQGPLSPRRTAELSGRSRSLGGNKGKGHSKDGSDGTPSMGSSFSDLDDASVTQSALEEALASKMQDGGTIGSRMSTISQAIRSRYLPKANRP